MLLKLKTHTTDANTFNSLRGRGFQAKLLTNGIAVPLTRNPNDGTYGIPSGVSDYDIVIQAEESVQDGLVTVVCGSSKGRALRPFFYASAHGDARDIQALFDVLDSCVTVAVRQSDKLVEMAFHEVRLEARTARIANRTIWKGGLTSLEQQMYRFTRYSDALNAALNKAGCPNCSCAHYIYLK